MVLWKEVLQLLRRKEERLCGGSYCSRCIERGGWFCGKRYCSCCGGKRRDCVAGVIAADVLKEGDGSVERGIAVVAEGRGDDVVAGVIAADELNEGVVQWKVVLQLLRRKEDAVVWQELLQQTS
jgi:hypothetical protein